MSKIIEFGEKILNQQKNKKSTTKDKIKVNLPQRGCVLQSEFIYSVTKILKSVQNLYYRSGDDAIVEFFKEKLRLVIPARMVTLIESYTEPGTWDNNFEFVTCSATEQQCKILLSSLYLKTNLPEIEKLLSCPMPFLINEELHFPQKGYNAKLKLYLSPNAPSICKRVELEEAKKALVQIHSEFCFKTEKDLFKSLMALITPFCRGLYKEWNTRTAIFIYYANRERAGKDYLAGIKSILYQGVAVEEPPIATGRNDGNEELRKKILSLIMAGKIMVHFSNNKGLINNSVLEQISTSKTIRDRVLGGNKIVEFENAIEISLSANLGTRVTADLANRSVAINLHLLMENANERNFKNPNLHGHLLKKREYYIACIFELILHWYKKGMKKSDVPFSSFPEWAGIVGGIMESVGWQNPLKNLNQANEELDSELAEMKEAFELGYEVFPEQWISKQQFKSLIEEDQHLFSFLDFSKKSDQTRFGYIIEKYYNRELSNIILKIDKSAKRKSRWKLCFTKDSSEQNTFFQYLEDEVINLDSKEEGGNLGNLPCIGYHPQTIKILQNKVGYGNLGNLGNLDKGQYNNNNIDICNITYPAKVTKVTKVTTLGNFGNINTNKSYNNIDICKINYPAKVTKVTTLGNPKVTKVTTLGYLKADTTGICWKCCFPNVLLGFQDSSGNRYCYECAKGMELVDNVSEE